MPYPQQRLRRLRRTRRCADSSPRRGGRRRPGAPLFVREGIDRPNLDESLPGVVQHTRASLRAEVAESSGRRRRGHPVRIPEHKDAEGSGASDPDGMVQLAIKDLRDAWAIRSWSWRTCVSTSTPITDSPDCSPRGIVDNDATMERYAEAALAQADAGVDVCAPWG